MALTDAPPDRRELPRPGLQEVCWECGHVFVERYGDLCDGCALLRRDRERLRDRRLPEVRRCD